MYKLCNGVLDLDAKIKLVGNDKVYQVIAFSYINSTDINMTLESPNGNRFIVTRTRSQIYCLNCINQK